MLLSSGLDNKHYSFFRVQLRFVILFLLGFYTKNQIIYFNSDGVFVKTYIAPVYYSEDNFLGKNVLIKEFYCFTLK